MYGFPKLLNDLPAGWMYAALAFVDVPVILFEKLTAFDVMFPNRPIPPFCDFRLFLLLFLTHLLLRDVFFLERRFFFLPPPVKRKGTEDVVEEVEVPEHPHAICIYILYPAILFFLSTIPIPHPHV